MAQTEVKVKLDLPEGIELLGYERCGEGHGFEVKFPLPLYCRGEKCRSKEPAKYEYKNTVYQLKDDKKIDPARVINHVGFDEISLKKRHKLYVTLMTDLTAPRQNSNWPNSAREPNHSGWTSRSSGPRTTTGRPASSTTSTAARTSAAVEGINNKARVITKRCYGVKSAGTLFSRLILDLNRASEAAGRRIGELRQIAAGLKAEFLAFCT